nr:hypothetical protein [Tanacetum cinerariifolium]
MKMDSMIPTGQKNTLAEYMILSGADNRPPMLDKDYYNSWKSRMEVYMQNKEHRRMILESVEHGPLVWPTIEENESYQRSMRKSLTINARYFFNKAEKGSANYSGLAVLVFKQGDNHIDAINKMMPFLSTVVTSRFPSTNNQLRSSSNPRQQATVHDGRVTVQPLQGRQNSYAAGTSGTRANTLGTSRNYSGQQRVVKCFNSQGDSHMARQYLKPKRKRDATWFREKVLLVKAQGNELEFLADPGIAEGPVIQSVITHNAAYQTDDLDAYDSDCEEISTAKAILMANFSSYGSDVLSKITPMLYDDNVIAKETNVISIADSEETLMLEEESRSKMILKQNDPMVLEKKVNTKLTDYAELNRLSKNFVDNVAYMSNATTMALAMYKLNPIILASRVKNNRETHEYYLKHTMEQAAILREVVEQAKLRNPLDSASYSACVYVKLIQELLSYVRDTCPGLHKASAQALCSVCNECLFDVNHAICLIDLVNSINMHDKFASKKNTWRKEWKPTGKVFNSVGYKWKPTERTFTLVGNACPLTRITTITKVPIRVSIPLKMEPDTSRGSDTLVATSSSSLIDCRLSILFCGVDLLLASRGTNLYSLSIGDMMASSPICLLLKATKTKSWLWHRRLSHLNFGALNHLARNSLVRGLPRLNFKKDHLCSVCAMGKSKKQSHKPKSEDTNQEKLYLLHMDLCRPMRVESVNEKSTSSSLWMITPGSHGLEPTLHEITPATLSSGLIPNPPPLALFVSPSRHEWDLVFQPMFDEFFSLSASVVSSVLVEEAPAPVETTGSPSLTTVDQDAPSSSTSQTTPQSQSQTIPLSVEEKSYDLEVTHMSKDPYFGIPIPNFVSEESSSSDIISTTVHSDAPILEHLNKWIKDHQLQNIIVQPKMYKDVLTQSCWIEAMQKELHEFERREVWELVSRPDKMMVIILKWIYKAPRAWYDLLSSFLLSQGFSKGTVDPTLFISRKGKDILLSPRGIFLNQLKYALESLKKYGMESCDLVDSPMVEKSKLDEDIQGKAIDPTHYRGMIGTLIYLASSRPDLVYAVCMCARYQARTTKKHLHAVKRIFRYLRGTVNQGLWYSKDSAIALTDFADADHEACQDTRRSTSLADIFTKALCRERIEFLIDKLRMRSFTPETLKELVDEAEE